MQADSEEDKGEELELEDQHEQAASTVEVSEDYTFRRRKRRADEMEHDAQDRERDRDVKRPAIGRSEVLFRILCPSLKMGTIIGKARSAPRPSLPQAFAATCMAVERNADALAVPPEHACDTTRAFCRASGRRHLPESPGRISLREERSSRSLGRARGRESRRACDCRGFNSVGSRGCCEFCEPPGTEGFAEEKLPVCRCTGKRRAGRQAGRSDHDLSARLRCLPMPESRRPENLLESRAPSAPRGQVWRC